MSLDHSTLPLMAHADYWGNEPQPVLRDNRLRPRLRLEQERIGFGWVQQVLALPRLAALTLRRLGGSELQL